MDTPRSLTTNEIQYLKRIFREFGSSLKFAFWTLLITFLIFDIFFIWILPKFEGSQLLIFILLFIGINVLFAGLLLFIRKRFIGNADFSQSVVSISGNFRITEIRIPVKRFRLRSELYWFGENQVVLPIGWLDSLEEGKHVMGEGYPVPVSSFDRQIEGGPTKYCILSLNKKLSIDREVNRGFLKLKNNSLNLLLSLVLLTVYVILGHLINKDHGVHPTMAIYHHITGNYLTDLSFKNTESLLLNPPSSGRNVIIENAYVFKHPIRHGNLFVFTKKESDPHLVNGFIKKLTHRSALLTILEETPYFGSKHIVDTEILSPLKDNPHLQAILNYLKTPAIWDRKTLQDMKREVIEKMRSINKVKDAFFREENNIIEDAINHFIRTNFMNRRKLRISGYFTFGSFREFDRLSYKYIINEDIRDYIQSILEPVSMHGIFKAGTGAAHMDDLLDVENYKPVRYSPFAIILVNLCLILGTIFLIRWLVIRRYNSNLLKNIRS